jgi:sodium-dependent dicarboxylate transporter 2/3/5
MHISKECSLGVGLGFLLGSLFAVNTATSIVLIFIAAIWLWLTCSIEVGSIAALAALCAVPGIGTGAAITAAFGNTTIWFLIFSMALTYALSSSGVLRRIALYFIDNPLAKRNSYWFMGCYFLAILALGSFMAPTVTFVLFFGLVKEIYELLKLEPGNKMARNMMIGTGFFASISCAMTPIAHTFPLMAIGYYESLIGATIPYTAYMAYSLPVCGLIALAAYLLLIIGVPKHCDFSNVSFAKSKWTFNEIAATIVFACVVLCWLIVGIWPAAFTVLSAAGTVWPAMIGVAVLSAAGILNVKEAFSRGIAWPAIILCGTTLALGKYLTAEEYGIISNISQYFTNVNSGWILPIIIGFSVILTNLMSNIVTTTVSFNLFIPTIVATGMVSPVLATILIGVGASLAYALPSSIAHIALAGSSGWANTKDMMKYGGIMMIISMIVMGVFI